MLERVVNSAALHHFRSRRCETAANPLASAIVKNDAADHTGVLALCANTPFKSFPFARGGGARGGS